MSESREALVAKMWEFINDGADADKLADFIIEREADLQTKLKQAEMGIYTPQERVNFDLIRVQNESLKSKLAVMEGLRGKESWARIGPKSNTCKHLDKDGSCDLCHVSDWRDKLEAANQEIKRLREGLVEIQGLVDGDCDAIHEVINNLLTPSTEKKEGEPWCHRCFQAGNLLHEIRVCIKELGRIPEQTMKWLNEFLDGTPPKEN